MKKEDDLQAIIVSHIKDDPAIVALHKGNDPSATGNMRTWYLIIAKEHYDYFSSKLKQHPSALQRILHSETGTFPDIATHVQYDDNEYEAFVGHEVWKRA